MLKQLGAELLAIVAETAGSSASVGDYFQRRTNTHLGLLGNIYHSRKVHVVLTQTTVCVCARACVCVHGEGRYTPSEYIQNQTLAKRQWDPLLDLVFP